MPTHTPATAADVVAFWDAAGPAKWYAKDDAFDAEIRNRFLPVWEAAQAGACDGWSGTPQGALGKTILLDQFPRNMFREDPRAFATDEIAKATACAAIDQSWDLRIDPPMRQFFYLPFMHSEQIADQDHCVRLMKARLPQEADNLLHARVHREIIRRFGRFPYRNAALGRSDTAAERAFFEAGGYGAILRELQAA
jgi:uncharacterized protein (DUF924 family)